MSGYIDNLINDANFVLLCDHTPDIICTEDGTPILVSSTLNVRAESTAYGKRRSWLGTPPRYSRGRS